MNLNKSTMSDALDIVNERIIVADTEDEIENSFFEVRYHGRKILILAPHPDDEINVAGNMILNFSRTRAEIFVAFSTNGDFDIDASIRAEEAAKSLKILGVKRDHIIFLGYGDTYNGKGKPHLFNAIEPTVSPAGKSETYSVNDFVDYSFKRFGEHAKYTKENFLRDLKDLILNIEADIIFCVDFDFHADHRMLSLSFEQVIVEILSREGNDYKPEIYKSFAYSTAFNAIRDFYSENLLETKKPIEDELINHANYSWSERVRFPVAEDCRQPFIGEILINHNPIAKAIFAHKSQKNEWNALGILNSDEIFFERRTDNLIYTAEIESTSGDYEKVRDFKIINTDDVDTIRPKFCSHLWQPDSNDSEKKLKLKWQNLQQIEQIKIYGDINSEKESFLKVKINDSEREIKLPKHGLPQFINFDEKIFADEVEIQMLDEGGISEIEIFSMREIKRQIKPFIKITVDDNFIYDYYIHKNKSRLEFEIYRFHTDKPIELSVSDGVIYCADKKFVLQFDGDDVTIRAEICDETEIYDQIKIHRRNRFYFWKLKLRQFFDRAKIHFQRKFRC